jgi:CRISPR-associated protein Cmr6
MSSHKATERFNSKKQIEMPETITTDPEDVPMMYRAQIGRCSLQYAGSNNDRDTWVNQWVEWVYPIPNQPNQGEPRHQHLEDKLREPSLSFHCVKVEFPYRVFSNCGQDSIQRPVLDVRGIPFIPGSGVKGLFRRACQERDRAENRPKNESLTSKYCGDKENLKPGCLRFHGAYPIGNWANRVVDVVHPQQERQVKGKDSTSASTLISLYEPTLIFKFSSTDKSVDWSEVKTLLYEALRRGVGGKTSTGYGLGGKPEGQSNLLPEYTRQQSDQNVFHLDLKGKGISSLLLDKQHEFRPNLFKATLRGHLSRLLAGVCNCEPVVKAEVNRLLGGPDRKNTDREGVIQLFWESEGIKDDPVKRPTCYETEGILHIVAKSKAQNNDFNFVQEVLKFAYIMGGFGKSWRRVWHETFYPDYFKQEEEKFHIGCHWNCLTPNWVNFQSDIATQQLQDFLAQLYKKCCDRLRSDPPTSLNWREAWHPDRVVVYSNVVSTSQVVRLFHNHTFKTTPAIGGRKKVDGKEVLVTSSVWHRMLPLPDKQYLEIVTVFHGDRTPWKHRESSESQSQDKSKSSKDSKTPPPVLLKDQLKPFIQTIKSVLKITTPTWGQEPT